ncbi:MAG: L-lysine 6-transaminase [Bacteroidota bacterium]
MERINSQTGKPTTKNVVKVRPEKVRESLSKHVLMDGMDVVVDIDRSEGAYIYDAKSHRKYLDFFTFVASSPIGLNHPKMREPDFLERLTRAAVIKPSNSDIYTVEMAEFVETFCQIAMPSYLPHAFFIEGGALGVENALKTAFDWKIRKNFEKGYKEERGTQVVHFRDCFHGRTGYTLSLTNTEPAKTDLFPKFRWPRIPSPAIQFPLTHENLKAVEKAERTALDCIHDAIRTNVDDIAAIIIEPVQGEGGDNHFRKEFFEELRAIADEHEIMLIFDEVQTGIGLTGKMWAHEYFVKPDMLAFGKKTQVCGFLCSRRVDEVPDNVFKVPGRLNSTWGGSLVDMARSQRYLEVIEEEQLVENARTMGEYLRKNLEEVQEEFGALVGNARGRGLLCAFDLNSRQQRDLVKTKCFEKGLIVLGSGEQAIRFRPPLTVKKEELEKGLEIIRDVLSEISED